MAEQFINPLAGMENEPIDKKVCALMGPWVLYNKELEAVHHLIELTAIVAQQYIADAFADEAPKPAKKGRARVKAKAKTSAK